MKHIKWLSFFILVACASSPKSEKNDSTKDSTTEVTMLEQTVYSRGVQSVLPSKEDKSTCHKTGAQYNSLSWKELLAEANRCIGAEKWESVEEIGHILANQEPHSPWGAYYLGLKAEHDREWDRAQWMAEASVKRAPSVGLFHYQKGRILWQREQFKDSVEEFTKSLQLDPNIINAHLLLGQVFFREQEFPRAALHFQSVLKVRPKDATALMGLAECNIQNSDSRNALEILQKGERSYPADPVFLLREAYVYEAQLNDLSKALEVYTQIRTGYEKGKYKRELGFDLSKKIQDLDASLKGQRAVAESRNTGGAKK